MVELGSQKGEGSPWAKDGAHLPAAVQAQADSLGRAVTSRNREHLTAAGKPWTSSFAGPILSCGSTAVTGIWAESRVSVERERAG